MRELNYYNLLKRELVKGHYEVLKGNISGKGISEHKYHFISPWWHMYTPRTY